MKTINLFFPFILKSVCLDITTITAARHVNIPFLEKNVFKVVPVRKTCVTSCLGAEKASTFINILVYMFVHCSYFEKEMLLLITINKNKKKIFFDLLKQTIEDERNTVNVNSLVASTRKYRK